MRYLALLYLAASCAAGEPAAPAKPLSLWYRQSAREWVEALPVGNGRLGAMVFGGVARERIQFNEHTVWTGEPHDYAHPGAYKHLATLRTLLFQGKQAKPKSWAWKSS
jgi:alpha-L-fucosidase 2